MLWTDIHRVKKKKKKSTVWYAGAMRSFNPKGTETSAAALQQCCKLFPQDLEENYCKDSIQIKESGKVSKGVEKREWETLPERDLAHLSWTLAPNYFRHHPLRPPQYLPPHHPQRSASASCLSCPPFQAQNQLHLSLKIPATCKTPFQWTTDMADTLEVEHSPLP